MMECVPSVRGPGEATDYGVYRRRDIVGGFLVSCVRGG